jgi:hypothetical protein
MKNEPSATLREVWAIKQAAQEETAHLLDPADYFRYIRQRTAGLNLPTAPGPRRPAPAPGKRNTRSRP